MRFDWEAKRLEIGDITKGAAWAHSCIAKPQVWSAEENIRNDRGYIHDAGCFGGNRLSLRSRRITDSGQQKIV